MQPSKLKNLDGLEKLVTLKDLYLGDCGSITSLSLANQQPNIDAFVLN